VSLSDIPRIERMNDCAIHVFADDGKDKVDLMHLYATTHRPTDDSRIVCMLLIGDRNVKNADDLNHYVWIKDMSRLLSHTSSKYGHRKHYCLNCLHGFTAPELLADHKAGGCDLFEPTRIIMPDLDHAEVKFKDYAKTIACPYVIYANT